MKKSEYEQYIHPKEFAKLYDEWTEKGKPQGNNSLYIKIWNGVENAVKACIGSLQNRYHCKYQDYDDKVMDSTILIMNKLLTMSDTPKNIVSLSYLPVLGVCCGLKAIQSEWENNMLSTEEETSTGDTFTEMLYTDKDGTVQYVYNNY